MMRIFALLALVVAIGFGCHVQAQDARGERARELAAALDKTKHKVKEKKNVSFESYVDVKNEAALRKEPSGYSGVYDSDGYSLDLRVSPSGEASGSGEDSPKGDGPTVKFELRNARVEGALLTGIKVYSNGEARKFEAVFVNRTVSIGKNKDDIGTRDTTFGLGFVEGGPVLAGDKDGSHENWTNRVFLEKKN